MNIFKFFKRNTIEKTVTKTVDEESYSFTIPKASFEDGNIPSVTDENNSFSVIIDKDSVTCENVLVRVNSNDSTEVFRMHCNGYEYSIGNIMEIAPDLRLGYYSEYLKGTRVYHFILRVFETNNGNYFVQTIRSDGSTRFRTISRSSVQDYMKKCEATDEKDRWTYENDSPYRSYVRNAGEYTKKTFEESDCISLKDHESVGTYEIIDSDRYYKIIETF